MGWHMFLSSISKRLNDWLKYQGSKQFQALLVVEDIFIQGLRIELNCCHIQI